MQKSASDREQWLHSEIARWQQEGLINAEQASELTTRYPVAVSADDGWGKVIFAGLGALIFGLGIILIFAYNWQGMHRYVKLSLVFAGLLSTHAIGLWLNRPGGAHRKLGEALHLLGTMLFGAGIWLVAQIYHIDEHYPNAYFVWSLGALAMAWALPSIAQGLLAIALVFLWTWFKAFDFHHMVHWGPVLIAIGVLPLSWLMRSRALLAFGLIVFLMVYAFSLSRVNDDLVASALMLWSGALLGLARVARTSKFAISTPILTGIGGSVFVVLLFVFSFSEVAGDLLESSPEGAGAWLYSGLPIVAAIAAWGVALGRQSIYARGAYAAVEDGIVLLMMTLVMIGTFGIDLGVLIWIGANLAVIVLSAIYILRGIRELRWQQVALGCLLIAAEVFARFMDLFDSLLLRSTVFLVLGAALFGVGMVYSRQKLQVRGDA